MRPRSLVWIACTSVAGLLLALMLAAGGNYAPEGRAGADPSYEQPVGGDPSAVAYVSGEPYALDGEPLPVATASHAPSGRPGSWAGVICGLGMLGLFIFLGILALRGTADNGIRIREIGD